MAGAAYHTFLSHNGDDKPAVEELAHRLRAAGIMPWLDKWNLIPGNSWQEEIEQALADCASCCVFIGPSGIGPWQNAEMRAAIDRRVGQGRFRVIPVLLPGAERQQRSSYPVFLTQTTWVEFRRTLDDEDAFRRLAAGIRGIAPGPGPALADQNTCPYRGLQVFDVEHASSFFGREALVEWMVEALRPQRSSQQTNRFLAIVGASGSGKSSLARAGLIPALRDGRLPTSETWPIVTCKPGPDPIESLAVALKSCQGIRVDLGDIGDLKKRLAEEKDRLHLLSRLALGGQPEDQRLVILVDQFEELFTLCRDERLRRGFIENLLYAATEPVGKTIVLLTMRADFYGKCAAYEGLAIAMSDHQMLIIPMSDRELRDAIVRPAQLTGCEFEPGLVEILIDDFKNESGALPLLQYALAQLWEARDVRRLTVQAYNTIGKLEGALEKRANEVYDHLTPEEREVCKQIFLRLTQPGEGTEDTKRRAHRTEIGHEDLVDDVVNKLARERLITTEGEVDHSETFVEVAHEALIRAWPRLRQWVDENRDGLRVHTRLAEAAYEWHREQEGEPDDYVYRGARLAEVEEWIATSAAHLSDIEAKFVRASLASREAKIRTERTRRKALYSIVTVSVLVLGSVLGLSWTQFQQARRADQQLAQVRLARDVEASRTDISGALIAFGTTYGETAQEVSGRGLFTSLLEKSMFEEYVSVSRAVERAQSEMLRSSDRQRAEALSSLNGEIILNPRNPVRRFAALVVGWDGYEQSPLKGAVADARSVHEKLVQAGYDSTLLADASADELKQALDTLLSPSIDCSREEAPPFDLGRGIQALPLAPCRNVVLFLYLSGHGFVANGATYVIPAYVNFDEARPGTTELTGGVISIESLRGRMAEVSAVQILIADVSRGVWTDDSTR